MSDNIYAIIGAGAAGISATQTLRREGFDGRLVLLGDERVEPYERPPLSKKFLRGEVAKESVRLRPPSFFKENAVDVRLDDPVVKLDVAERGIHFAGGDTLQYDKVLLTTGASPVHLDGPGADLDGIHYLRTLHDCEQIRGELERQSRILVLGTGFIGCEVAASLRQIDCAVTLVGKDLPLAHVLGQEIGSAYASYYRAKGMTLKTGASIAEFRGSKRVQEAALSDNTTVSCDAVVVGIGVRPSLTVVPGDIRLENGIATDEFCKTNVDNVWAAGDVAASWRPRLQRRVRFEHFVNAQLQGAAAAKSMLGKMEPYDPIPYFWSDQFDSSLQYYGYAAAWDACVLRGDPPALSFVAFYLKAGRIDAVCIVNQPKNITAAKHLLGQTGLSPVLLADDKVELKDLAAAPQR